MRRTRGSTRRRRMTRRTLAASACVFLLMPAACDKPPAASPGAPSVAPSPEVAQNASAQPNFSERVIEDNASRPLLFILRYPSNAFSGIGRESGLVAAVWPDGRVLRAVVDGKRAFGASYEAGSIGKADLASIDMEALSTPLWDSLGGHPVDSAYEELYVVSGARIRWAGQTRPLHSQSRLRTLEERLLHVPLSDVKPADAQNRFVPPEWYQ